jgi:hypothetical protein
VSLLNRLTEAIISRLRLNEEDLFPNASPEDVVQRKSLFAANAKEETYKLLTELHKTYPQIVVKKVINPLTDVRVSEVTKADLELLKQWASVGASVGASVRDSVWASVRDSVWASVRGSVWGSVWDSVGVYTGSFFNIKYRYDFSSSVKLWEKGLVPSFDRRKWRLHAGPDAKVMWEGTVRDLEKALKESKLYELRYSGFKSKQKSITRLFPKFPERKKAIYANGGIRLSEQFPELWWFKVASGTQSGVEYDVYLHFKNILDTIKQFVGNKELWTKDGLRVNFNALSPQVFNEVDLAMDCSCDASRFWGPNYIRTQRQAQFGDQENRPPKIRNPREYGISCKHADNVLERLPFYTQDFAKHLRTFYGEDIQKMVDKIREDEEKSMTKKMNPAEEQQEEQWRKGEEQEENPEANGA